MCHVDDSVFDAVRPHFSARELVELVVTIAAYNNGFARARSAADPLERRARCLRAKPDHVGASAVNYFHGEVLASTSS